MTKKAMKQDQETLTLDSIAEAMRKIFVDWPTFNWRVGSVERIIYGACGMILIAFLSAVIVYFVKK